MIEKISKLVDSVFGKKKEKSESPTNSFNGTKLWTSEDAQKVAELKKTIGQLESIFQKKI